MKVSFLGPFSTLPFQYYFFEGRLSVLSASLGASPTPRRGGNDAVSDSIHPPSKPLAYHLFLLLLLPLPSVGTWTCRYSQ